MPTPAFIHTPLASADDAAPPSQTCAAGYLVAFDGTWNDAAKDSVIHRFFRDHYAGTAKTYYPGVGAGAACGPVERVLGGAFGWGATGIVAQAFDDLATFYRDPANRGVAVDFVGYSRGAFQAVRLAHRLLGRGFPGAAPFHPRVRFVGLLSPVGQMGAVFTRLDFGWAKALPPGIAYAFQALASDPGHRLWMETKLDTSLAATSVCPPRFADGHAAIGWAGEVLDALVLHAARAGAPIRGAAAITSAAANASAAG